MCFLLQKSDVIMMIVWVIETRKVNVTEFAHSMEKSNYVVNVVFTKLS